MKRLLLFLLLVLFPAAAHAQVDAIDLQSVQIVNAVDVRSWPVTTSLTSVSFTNGITHVAFTKQDGAGRWPDVTPPGWDGPLQYTLWLFVRNGDGWAASAFIQFWYGRDGSGYPGDPDVPSVYHKNWYYSSRWAPVYGHGPIQPGELIGFMVTSGNQRDKVGPDSVHERSNIVTFKATDSGSYVFDAVAPPPPAPPAAEPPPVVAPPAPVPPPTVDLSPILARLQALEEALAALGVRVGVLEARKIPASCVVSAAYGVRLSCKLQ